VIVKAIHLKRHVKVDLRKNLTVMAIMSKLKPLITINNLKIMPMVKYLSILLHENEHCILISHILESK
jgi:hypothetical protein